MSLDRGDFEFIDFSCNSVDLLLIPGKEAISSISSLQKLYFSISIFKKDSNKLKLFRKVFFIKPVKYSLNDEE